MFALTPLFIDFGSGIVCLAGCVGRKLVLFIVMGRKGKRVHEQSAGSSAPAFDYETIRLIPTQKQESTGTGSSAPSGISAPPGPGKTELTPLGHLWDQLRVPSYKSANIVPYLAVDVILRMYFTDVSSCQLVALWLKPFPIRAVGLSSLAFTG